MHIHALIASPLSYAIMQSSAYLHELAAFAYIMFRGM